MPLASITSSITGAIGDAGVYAVFGLMVLDAVFPAASEVVMVYAGAVAVGAFADAGVSLFGAEIESTAWGYAVMALAGTIGYWVGALLGWGIGIYGDRPFLDRYGRFFHLTPDRLERADAWFERRGDAAVFLGRMLPVIRSFISIPAGVAEMRLGRYAALTLLGTVPWCFGLAGAGVGLGTGWERFHEGFRYADYAVAALAAAAAVYLVVRVRRQRIRRQVVEPSGRS